MQIKKNLSFLDKVLLQIEIKKLLRLILNAHNGKIMIMIIFLINFLISKDLQKVLGKT
jgi:hypothetical protein